MLPYQRGKCLVWDSTCVDTYCASAIGETAIAPGAAARSAEERKRAKYSALTPRFQFEVLAVETSGSFGPASDKFVAELGRRVTARTGDKRETAWLRQRISLAIVRGNAAALVPTGGARVRYCLYLL